MLLKLVLPGKILDLADRAEGWINSSIELGAPSPREDVEDTPGADGTDDNTALVGNRAVTIKTSLVTDPNPLRAMLDQVDEFMHASLRPEIWYQLPGDTESPARRITVRPMDDPLTIDRPDCVDLVLPFKSVGYPYPRAAQDEELVVAPVGPEPGITFPITFPLIFPPAPSRRHDAYNFGNTRAHWTARICGPTTAPVVRNETLGQQISIPDLDIPAGSFVDVSSEDMTVVLDESESRLTDVDFLGSDWWLLAPGSNEITFSAASYASPAQLLLTYAATYRS